MRKLILREITLVSLKEKKARKFKFHPKVTVIKGENHTGKSSLIKSIYWAFGAKPKKVHPNWEKADVITSVRFSIENDDYLILRKGEFFAIFDGNYNVLGTFDKITTALGPYLSELFGYKIKLNSRNNNLITPPPAYFLLPYYIDQDVSWNENWSAFSNLGQLSNWRNNIINYHTGIKPNEYYEIKAKIEDKQLKIKDIENKKSVSQIVLDKLLAQFKSALIDFDINVFRQEIDELMEKYERIKVVGQRAKDKIIELKSDKLHLQNHIDILKNAVQELRNDYQYALKQPDAIDCPTCGHTYENSFAERFTIAKDEDSCQELLIQLNEDMKDIDTEIKKEYIVYQQNNKEASKIQDLLEQKQGKIKLRDVIQNEGKKELKDILQNEINSLKGDISDLQENIDSLRKDLKEYENRKRQEEIKRYYLNLMRGYLLELDVNTMEEKSYKAITSKISESGSGLPRALLAYYYSVLHTMNKYGTSTFCPIIIDSPNQQDQDQENLDRMMNFIFDNQPESSQLILGLVELGDYKFEGEIIELTHKYNLLQESGYKEISREIRFLLDKSINL
ncbi:hypothetical protein P9D98_10675 [Bacillus mojavensis]|uniref:hypothetical protein n=1 Tax=Bacillus mojavensis TaxID=72360 RepID=UPI002DBF8181|nr:hypothetical protein [Bacillus mojavensis]MEC1635120.1 hypothetical protein [Bacillus mojavensis]